MPDIIPEWKDTDIDGYIDGFVHNAETKIFEALSYVGIEAVKYAKQYHGYRDQSGNLTASIGYAIIRDGDIISRSAPEGGAGEAAQSRLLHELSGKHSAGYVLVVVAGMEYAAAVESKGYDVISGASMWTDTELVPMLKELIAEA